MPDGDRDATFVQSDARKLPWPDGFFTHAVSHGVLDSMPFEIARDACRELARAMTPARAVDRDSDLRRLLHARMLP